MGLRKAHAALDAIQPAFYPIDAERLASEVAMKLGNRKLERGHAAFETGDVSLDFVELHVDPVEAHPRKVMISAAVMAKGLSERIGTRSAA